MAYVQPEETLVKVFQSVGARTFDTSGYLVINFAYTNNTAADTRIRFTKYSFDIDVVTLPLKFRPGLEGFPAQLNSSINGGIFIGRRSDTYRLRWPKNRLIGETGTLQHLGVSAGLFAGVGSTAMNPSVTRNEIAIEYDGLVIPAGFTALMGYNNLTFGGTFGIDYLVSSHRTYWIYRTRPWFGLTLGLNLN